MSNEAKRNYDREMEAEIAALEGRRPALLLHSCCGPCSSAVLERLRDHFRVTVLYYNPNIEPEEEYLHRKAEQRRLLEALGGDTGWLECPYDHEAFEAFAPAMAGEPEGGKRCLACFAMRLNETAEQARKHGFEYFTTTLSVTVKCSSPSGTSIASLPKRSITAPARREVKRSVTLRSSPENIPKWMVSYFAASSAVKSSPPSRGASRTEIESILSTR